MKRYDLPTWILPMPINYSLDTVIDTAAVLAAVNPILLDGQLGREVDTNKFKVGNGVLNWNSIDYYVTNNTASVFSGASEQAHNLITHSTEDGGLVLSKETLNCESVIEYVLDETLSLSDRVAFAVNKQHQLATLILAVYTKRLAEALGGGFTSITTPVGYTGNSLSTIIDDLQSQINGLGTTTAGLIDDVVTANTSTWSSTKIASEILSAIQGLRTQLIGDAGEALDTIYELAEALQNNSGYITTLLDEVSKAVKFTAQTLTSGQQIQARDNIAAASGVLVGTYSEIDDTTLEEHLGDFPDDTPGDTIALAALVDAVGSVSLKTHLMGCSMYKSSLHAPSSQYLTITWRRQDNSIAGVSTLSDESVTYPGKFTTRTETLYAGNGTTVVRTTVFALSYDASQNLLSDVIVSIT